MNRFVWFSSFDISVLDFGQFRDGNSFMWPLILVLNHVGGQSCYNLNNRVCPISKNVCVVIPAYALNKIFEQINDSIVYTSYLYFEEKKKSNKSDKTL